MDLSVATRQGRGLTVVQVSGVLDLATVPDLRSSLQHALDDGARTVMLDLTGVPFIDSTALGMIAWLHKESQDRGGRVGVAATAPIVLRVLTLASMDRLVKIYDSAQVAEDDLSTDGQP